jgi:DNA-binding IclR family transcriptional regulator
MDAPSATSRAERNARVQTVDRALQMLSAFTTHGQHLRITDFTALLGVHKSTASRLAATLEAHGFVERAPGDAFRLGPEVTRLGLLAISGRDLVSAARAAMDCLAASTGQTVTLSIREGAQAATIVQVNGRYIIGTTTWVSKRTPLHATSDGKVLLAFSAPELDLDSVPLEPLTKRTITRQDGLARQLRRVRNTHWAVAVGDLEVGLNGVASPIVDGEERCVAALSVSGPAYRVPPKRFPELVALCQEASEAISARLGRARRR